MAFLPSLFIFKYSFNETLDVIFMQFNDDQTIYDVLEDHCFKQQSY